MGRNHGEARRLDLVTQRRLLEDRLRLAKLHAAQNPFDSARLERVHTLQRACNRLALAGLKGFGPGAPNTTAAYAAHTENH